MIILTKKNIKKIIIYIIIASIVLAIFLYVDRKVDDNVTTTSAETSNGVYEILVDVEESVLYLIQDKQIVKTYSDYIRYPIKMDVERTEKKEDKEEKVIETETLNSMVPIWKKKKGKDTWGEGFRRKMDGPKCSLG